MRNYIFALSGVILLLAACGKDKRGCTDPNAPLYDPEAEMSSGNCGYPSETQRAIVMLSNKTDDVNAGSFFLPVYQNLINSWGNRIVPMVIHPVNTDPLFSGPSVNLSSNFGGTSLPNILIGDDMDNLSQAQATNAVEQALGQPCVAGIKSVLTLKPDSAIITVYGVLFGDISGEIFASGFLLEDDVNQSQAGAASGFKHSAVLRAAGNNGFGSSVLPAGAAAGTSFKVRYGILLDSSWDVSKLSSMSAVWEKQGSDFHFLNASKE